MAQISLFDAIKNKYLSRNDELENLSISIDNKFKKFEQPVIFIGKNSFYQKHNDLQKQTTISLQNMNISNSKKEETLSSLCPNLISLNLRDNLFSDQSDIALIVSQLKLQELDLSKNNLSNDLNPEEFLESFKCLRVLNLSSVSIKIQEQICKLEINKSIKNLEEIYLCDNKINQISNCLTNLEMKEAFLNLKIIDFSHNKLSDQKEIESLSKLPSLEKININNNQFKNIQISKDKSDKEYFDNLKTLFFKHNLIEEFSETFESLTRLPSLINLSITHNPISEKHGIGFVRQIIIGKMKKLLILNGSEISKQERKDCDIFYAKHSLEYNELATKIGEKLNFNPENELIELKFLPMDPQSLNFSTQSKKVHIKTKIYNLKFLCERLFHIASQKQRLYFRIGKEFPIFLEDENKTLLYYGVNSDGEILLNTNYEN